MVVQESLGTLKSEMKRAMAKMMEKLDFMIKKLEGQDPEMKETGLATTSPKTTQTSEIPPNSHEIGASIHSQNRSKETTVKGSWRLIENLPVPLPLPTISDAVLDENFVNEEKPLVMVEVKMRHTKGFGQSVEWAQRVEDWNKALRQAQFNSSPNRSRGNNPSPNTNFNSHNFPYQTTYVLSPTPIVIPSTTAVTVRPPTPMEKGPPIKRFNETQVSTKSMVKAFQKKGQGAILESESLGVEIEKLDLMIKERGGLERERHEKGIIENSPELTITSKISPKLEEVGVNTRITHRREDLDKKERRWAATSPEWTINSEISPKSEECGQVSKT